MFHLIQKVRSVQTPLMVLGAVMFLAAHAMGDTVTQVKSQTMGKHWMMADDGGDEYWSNALVPTNIHDYVCPAGMVLRTPEGVGDPPFAGGSLRIDAGATLALKMNYGQDSVLLGDLTMNGGILGGWRDTTGTGYLILNLGSNTLTIAADSPVALVGDNRRRVRIANGTLTGSGAFIVNGLDSYDLLEVYADVNGSTFDGDWVVNGGTLRVGSNVSALGTAAGVTRVNHNMSVAGINSPTLELGGVIVTNETLIMSSEFNNHRTRLMANGGVNEWGGPIQFSGDGSIQVTAGSAATSLRLSGNITGSDASTLMFRGGGQGEVAAPVVTPNAAFFKTDAGRWTLMTNGHDWASQQIANGTLVLGVDDGLVTDIALQMGQSGSSAFFDMAGYDQTVAGLYIVGGSPVTQTIGNSSMNRNSVLTIDAGATTFGGTITDTIGVGTMQVSLRVADGAQFRLSGANTYTGPTRVSSATLRVSGSIASAVTITNGSTFGGGGVCGSNVMLAADCVHEPGYFGTGTDAIYGDYDLQGMLEIELSGTSGGANDSVFVSNTWTIGSGAVLNVTELSSANDPVYVIGEYGTRVGEFAETNGIPADYSLIYDFGANSNQLVIARPLFIWDGGAPDDSWASGTNWMGDVAPAPVTDGAAIFEDAGTAVTNTTLTSELDQNRSVAGLVIRHGEGTFHRLDLNGSTLTVDGDLAIGEAGSSTFVTVTNSADEGTFVITNGALSIGYNGGVSTLDVDASFVLNTTNEIIDMARREGPVTSNTISTIDLSGASSVNIRASQILMASQTAENGGRTRGIMTLSAHGTNVIVTTNMLVGVSPVQGNNDAGYSEINFGSGENTAQVDLWTMPYQKSQARATVLPGGTLKLRGMTKEGMTLRLGYNAANTGTPGIGDFDSRGATLDAVFDTLYLGQHTAGTGSGQGSFHMDAGLGVAGNIVFGTTGGSNPQNTIGELRVDGGEFIVTDSTTNGNGRGVLRIANGEATVTNTLNVNTVVVGGDGNVNGLLTVVGAAIVGTGADVRSFYVARNLAGSDSTSRGVADFSACSSVFMNLNNFGIGTGSHSSYGTLLLSETGTNTIIASHVTLGDVNPQGNTAEWSTLVCGGTTHVEAANVYIGRKKSLGEIKFGAGGGILTMGATNSPVGFLGVGYNDTNTGAPGQGLLNGSNGTVVVYADRVLLGKHRGTSLSNGSGTGTVFLDSPEDVFVANTMTLGEGTDGANSKGFGHVYMSGGTMDIGELVIGNATNNGTGQGTVALSGGTLTAGTIRRGLNFGTSGFTFDWTGGELTVGTFDEDLSQVGGALVPGGMETTGVTTVTGDYGVAGAWSIQLDGEGAGTNDSVVVNGALTLEDGADLSLSSLSTVDDEEYVIAEYGTLNGTFSAVTGKPSNYRLEYAYGTGANQIALVRGLPGMVLIVR